MQFGIDFSGGTLIQLKYDTAAPIPQIREILEKQGSFQNLSVTEFGSKEEITIRFLGSNDSLGSDIGEHISTLLKDTGNLKCVARMLWVQKWAMSLEIKVLWLSLYP